MEDLSLVLFSDRYFSKWGPQSSSIRRTCEKCKFLGHTPDLRNQKVMFLTSLPGVPMHRYGLSTVLSFCLHGYTFKWGCPWGLVNVLG